jgi:hypothetical protein
MSDDNLLLATAPSRSIADWCKHRGISRAKFYQLDKAGLAPRTFNIGTKRIISPVADVEWLRQREAESGAAQ